ncbi:MAG: hypothetical protein ACYC99_17080, partial [Candidatus Geothermincolia bacterium]
MSRAKTSSAGIRVTYNHSMKKTVSFILAALLIVAALGASSCARQAGVSANGPTRIGVLLPLSGDRPLDWERILDWEASAINAGLRDSGFGIELVYKDTFGLDVSDLANELISDPS